jgi:hypothetical protein
VTITFDGTYRLKPFGGGRVPIRKWTDAWRVRVIDFSLNRQDVLYLRPCIVVAVRESAQRSNTTCAESMGRRICRDFHLNIREILWVERLPDKGEKFFIATFRSSSHRGDGLHKVVAWRSIRANEFSAIKPFIPEIEGAKG